MLCDLVVISFSFFFCASNLRLQQLPIRCLRWLYSDVGTYKRKKKQSKTKLPRRTPFKKYWLNRKSHLCASLNVGRRKEFCVSSVSRSIDPSSLSLSLFFLSFLFIFFFPRWHRIGQQAQAGLLTRGFFHSHVPSATPVPTSLRLQPSFYWQHRDTFFIAGPLSATIRNVRTSN